MKCYEEGISNYRIEYGAKMVKLFDKLKTHKGLYLNSNVYFGVGLNACESNSKQCTQKVVEELISSAA